MTLALRSAAVQCPTRLWIPMHWEQASSLTLACSHCMSPHNLVDTAQYVWIPLKPWNIFLQLLKWWLQLWQLHVHAFEIKHCYLKFGSLKVHSNLDKNHFSFGYSFFRHLLSTMMSPCHLNQYDHFPLRSFKMVGFSCTCMKENCYMYSEYNINFCLAEVMGLNPIQAWICFYRL